MSARNGAIALLSATVLALVIGGTAIVNRQHATEIEAIATETESMRELAEDLVQLQLALCEEMGGIVTYTVIPGYDTAQAKCEAREVTP